MEHADPLKHLQSALHALAAWFDAANIKGAVIGGVAASVLGRPRVTGDIDAVVIVEESGWPEFLRAGRPLGFEPRRPDFLEFARVNRVLLLRHVPSNTPIDISLGGLAFEFQMIDSAKRVSVGGVTIPLPLPEDLIVMKALAGRARDAADIESVLDASPNVDLERVRRLVSEMAHELEAPEIADNLEQILKRRDSAKRRTK